MRVCLMDASGLCSRSVLFRILFGGLVDADIFAFVFWCNLGRGSTTRPWVHPIFESMSAARRESISRKWEQHDNWPLFASLDQVLINCGSGCAPQGARRPRPRRHLASRKNPSNGACVAIGASPSSTRSCRLDTRSRLRIGRMLLI